MDDAPADDGTFAFVTDERGGVTVVCDGHPQSYVDLDDPAMLAFEYVQHLAHALDLLPDGPIAVTHAGGAGMTLPRYVQHTRPGSPQIVLDPDAALTEAVRRELPLARGHRIRVRALDALVGLDGLKPQSADAFVLDAYAEGRVPAPLTTVETLGRVAEVLRPEGLALLNLADEPDQRYLARVLATLHTALPHLAIIATHELLKRKRFGNYVVVAGGSPFDVDQLRRLAARSPFPTGVRSGGPLERLRLSARPLTSHDSMLSPPPPDPGRWRIR
ncbi:spermidine synthase [Leekyejoonella antrihumi]|uniref:Spermidine synthase n=1 Tax=Leekyejoonella antrihumi TaxID=1660198 RepID=A0A563E9Q3_9MICO|nr:fused MFS/spermidine synthase [Leekyejoonella antrihumi]TWP38963.1 hypothetical protein FGL98_00775 [Leekyejoonella antrihumi]